MGYYYSASGYIEFKPDITREQAVSMMKELDVPFALTWYDQKRPEGALCSLDVQAGGNYIEEEWHGTLHKIAPFVYSSEIYCEGEDDSHWRFVFNDGSFSEEDIGEFVEENGAVFYTSQIDFYGHMVFALKKFIQEVAVSVSDGHAALLCKEYGLRRSDLKELGLEHLTDLW